MGGRASRGAIELDGATCMDLGTAEVLNFTTALSVSMWIYPNAVVNDGPVDYFIGKRAYAALNGWRVGLRNAQPSFEFGIPASRNPEVLGPARATQQWVHIAVTYEGGSMSLFVDGQRAGTLTDAVPPSIVPNITTFRIGCAGGPPADHFANARIDDLRVYSHGLLPREVLALFTNGN